MTNVTKFPSLSTVRRNWIALERYCARALGRAAQSIYHYHVPKTGGTSVNHAFCALAYRQEDALSLAPNVVEGVAGPMYPGRAVYMRMMRTPDKTITAEGVVLVGPNLERLRAADYFYGFSHVPFHQIAFRRPCFTMTILRDPVGRLLSAFNQLVYLRRIGKLEHYGLQGKASIVDSGFRAWIDTSDPSEVAAQLYFFSAGLDHREALENVGRVNLVIFNDALEAGVAAINCRHGIRIELPGVHAKKRSDKVAVSPGDMAYCRQKLAEEYAFYNEIRKRAKDGLVYGGCRRTGRV